MIEILSLFSGFDIKRVDSGAKQILAEIGIRVPDEKLSNRNLKTRGDRILIPETDFEEMANALRGRQLPDPASDNITIFPTIWVSNYYDPDSEMIKPYDTATLAEYTKLIDALKEEGVDPAVPGHPQDIHPTIRPG
jgi:hypothetical protein